ncbi:MAG TPA: TraR/DksA C4-type zinc finger protein [Gaiellaceae bacterium]|nr:TraR/DksA C4-type zinc finger protein [Gaiellaceae bacterium]
MSTIDTAHFRELLLGERGRVERALAGLRDGHPGSLEDEAEEVNGGLDTDDLGETASITLGREIDYTLGENAQTVLDEIDAALARIENGTYGKCTNCGKEIPGERLEVYPWASLCIDCARLDEG